MIFSGVTMTDKKKPTDSGPKIDRDSNNSLDHGHADRILKDLTHKLITEQRSYQKEISFKNARGQQRDIMMFITLAQRNSIDGKVVLGDRIEPQHYEKWSNDDPYAYKVFDYVECEMLTRELPMSMATAGKFLMGAFKACTNYLARMGAINRV